MTHDKQVRLGDGVATFTCGDTLWQKGASQPRYQWWTDQLRELAAQRPDAGVLGLTLIMAGSSPPDATVRKQMQADFRALGGKLRQLVVVPLGNSVWVSVVRTIVRGTLLLSGMSNRQQVGTSMHDGISRLRTFAGPHTPSRAELQAGIARLCGELGVGALEEAVS